MTASVFSAIEAVTARRLQGRSLQASEPFWGCDDTLFMCQPICMKQMGPVTTKVADSLCANLPMDQCACKCFHDAQWTCEGSSSVCKARYGAGELQAVGDKVCETRGAPKPAASTPELRVASACEPVTEMRGSAPTAECLAQWGTPAPSDEPPSKSYENWPQFKGATAQEELERKPLLDESSAGLAVLLAALALYA